MLLTDDTPNYPKKSKLTIQDARRIVAICNDLADLCTRITGEIDPAAIAMLKQAVNKILPENKSISRKFDHIR